MPVPADWPMFGQGPANTANNPTESAISIKNVAHLVTKWTVTTGGDVSARAAVVGGVAYFPDWGGNLWAVDANSGKVIWSRQIGSYLGTSSTVVSRTSPAVLNGYVYIGTQYGAYLLAINASNGASVWKTQLESADPYAIISASPAVVNGVVYTGVASLAEGASAYGITISTNPGPRGSVVAVNAADGSIKWQRYTVPAGYTGGGVWGSNLVVDAARNTVYAGTGDNYTHPASSAESASYDNFGDCVTANGGVLATAEQVCLSPNDYVDSMLALDATTGAVKWAQRLVTWKQQGVTDGSDDWNVDCAFGGSQCPTPPTGPDYDFGSAPNEVTFNTVKGPKTIIGAGQKSGIYYAMDPDTGALLWQTQVGPGSSLGGMEWGSASDGQRIYVSIANLNGISYPSPHQTWTAGSWAALDPGTGTILWQTADPNGAIDIGPLAVANGVVYAPSMAGAANAPTMLALNAASGQILWQFAAGHSVNAGATIVNGIVYWGSGYAHLGIPGMTGSSKTGTFYAFTNNGN
ncbi:MAG TPA: PQQ-binding-like beta-propeller repeat protein [Bryobacteraceae bacterium]|nr:PQQ-binding-like beta-propeller repeat protein [Bryobacteraceae bacterium]